MPQLQRLKNNIKLTLKAWVSSQSATTSARCFYPFSLHIMVESLIGHVGLL